MERKERTTKKTLARAKGLKSMRDRTYFFGRHGILCGNKAQEKCHRRRLQVRKCFDSVDKTVFPRSPCFSSHKEGEDFVFGETMAEYTVCSPGKRRTGRPMIHEIGSGSPVRLLSLSFPLMLTTAVDVGRVGGGGVRTRIRRCLQGVATSTEPDADRGQRTNKTAQFVPRL